MGHSDSQLGPACPSRVAGWWSHATTELGLPCCARSPCRHAVATTPADPQRPGCSRGSHHWNVAAAAFPIAPQGRHPHCFVSGPARRSLALRPACSLNRLQRPFDIASFSRFVTSSSVATATGWNNQLPGRDLHPQENDAFSRRTVHDSSRGQWTARRGSPDPAAARPKVSIAAYRRARVSWRVPVALETCGPPPCGVRDPRTAQKIRVHVRPLARVRDRAVIAVNPARVAAR